jgi:hypothetical protein
MYKMFTNKQVESFRQFMRKTPASALPSPDNPLGAFDDADALRRAMLGRDQRNDDFERGREHELQRAGQAQALDAIHKFARDRLNLSSGDQSTFEQLVENLCEAFAAGEGEDEQFEQHDVGPRSARDEPPAFPGRPRPGGGQDPLHGMDSRTRTKVLAMDAAAAVRAKQAADFEKRFPMTKRIGIL